MSIQTGGAIMNITRQQLRFPGLAFLVLLGACGGSGGDGDNTQQSSGLVQIAQSSYETTEGAVVNIFVNRSGGSSGALTVRYATVDGTALAGSDYAAASGSLNWPDGLSGNQTVSIAITDDNTAEALESFTLTLSNVSGGAMGANTSASIDIVDNDAVALAAIGAITELNSATVNGIRYDTGAASIYVNGLPATASDLKPGQIVSLKGEANFSNATGRADEIRYFASLIGPVEDIDATTKRLIVMGQTILTNDDTEFGTGIDTDTFAGLAQGSTAQISGFRNADGGILATRIETHANEADRQVIGTVLGLDPASMSFSMNRLIVDYSTATLIDLPEGMPVNGLLVMVRGTYSNGVLLVSEISSSDIQVTASGGRGHLAGIVTRFASPADFDLNGLRVLTGPGTNYVNGFADDLQANAEITIDGEINADGDLVSAHIVTFGRPVFDRTTSTYDFKDFTEISVGSLSRVIVTRGSEYRVQVTAGTGALGDLQVEQTGEKVSLGLSNTRIFSALITMPTLHRIEVSDNALANVTLRNFDQGQMTIDLGGVSTMRGEGLIVADLDATVSGVSLLDLGDIRPIGQASVDISGVSQATLNMGVSSTLTGSVRTGQGTGVSRLFYYGTNVSVQVTTDTLSTVTRLGDTRP
jgi:hypothetical protein